MISSTWHRERVRESRGIAASLFRGFLGLAERPYAWVVASRNRSFDSGKSPIRRVAVPVVSVGNLSVGGTGKTPLVAWLAQWFLDRGVRVALVSRGYGAAVGEANDEARELALRLPHVPHLQNRDRHTAAQRAIERHNAQLILLDDAYQHRRLHRDLDIVLLDGLDPFGGERLLPRGLLREPLANLSRAHVVVLTRADLLGEELRETIRRRVQQFAPHALWLEAGVRVDRLLSHGSLPATANQADADVLPAETRPAKAPSAETPSAETPSAETPSAETLSAETLRGLPVGAFSGIGNPAGFRRTLEGLGATIVGWREFPDHHRFDAKDLGLLDAWSAELTVAKAIVCTRKDWVKLDRGQLGGRPLWALDISLAWRTPLAALEERLETLGRRANRLGSATTGAG
jgi:tetraacyldisaccharide 4'-kinase